MKEVKQLILKYGQKHLATILLVALAVLVARALGVLPPIVIGRVIDQIGGEGGLLFYWLGLLIVLALLKLLILPWQSRYLALVVQDMIRAASVDWSQRILRKDFSFFQSTRIGSVMKASERGIMAYEKLMVFAFTVVFPAVIEISLIGAYLLTLAGWPILLVLGLYTILFAWVAKKTVRWRRPFIDKVNDAEDEIGDRFAEVFQSAQTLKIFGAWLSGAGRLNQAYGDYAGKVTNLAYASEWARTLKATVVTLATVSALGLGIFLVGGDGALSLGDFVVIFTLTTLFMGNVSVMAEAYQTLDQFKADKFNFDRILDYEEFREADLPAYKVTSPSSYDLRIKPFKYHTPEGKLILESPFEMSIPFGSKVAIVGRTGSGKTTLSKIIAGIYKTRGVVELGGRDILKISAEDLTKAMAVALQDPEFLSGPLSRAVLLEHFVTSTEQLRTWTEGLFLGSVYSSDSPDRPLEVNGLSGGEGKRLSLLRGLAAGRPITILDEPTSALDEHVASQGWKLILKEFSGRTLVCITHDERFLNDFDMLIRVDQGRVLKVVETGKS